MVKEIWRWHMLAAVLLSAVGCGSDLDLHPVYGKVLYGDGTPVAGGTVVCELMNATPRRSGNGAIGDDGSFELGTRREGDGLVVGEYSAIVLPPALSEEQSKRQPSQIHRRYSDPATSGLVFEVSRGDNEIELRVTRPGEPPISK